jgi:hypothetical protein
MIGEGAALPLEEVGVNVGVTICKKYSAKAAVEITEGKPQKVATFRRAVLVLTNLFFSVKKLPNGRKDLKTVKSGDPKQQKQTIAT